MEIISATVLQNLNVHIDLQPKTYCRKLYIA